MLFIESTMRTTHLIALALVAAPALAQAGVAASDGTKPIDLFDDVVFANDSVALSAAELPHIDATARWMKRHPHMRIVLEGHADKTGRSSYNDDLATRRLQMVRNHLYADGIAMDRIVLVVYGERDAEQDRASPLDRRVEMYATVETPAQIAKAQLDRTKAVEVVWTQKGVLYTEHNGLDRPVRTAKR